MKRHAQTPFLPGHQIALDREAGAIRLGDVEILQVGPHRADILRLVVPALSGNGRDRIEIVDADHFLGVQVEKDAEILDRMGVAVVVVVPVLDPDEPAHPAPIGVILLVVVGARGPGIDPASSMSVTPRRAIAALKPSCCAQRGLDAEDLRHREGRLSRGNSRCDRDHSSGRRAKCRISRLRRSS